MPQKPKSKPGLSKRPRCPKCSSKDITVRCDAYANYTLLGFDQDGDPILSDEPDVQTFDDRNYVCDECDHESGNSEEFLPRRAK